MQDHCSNNTIYGNIISNNVDGIYLWFYVDNNTIFGNIISNNFRGIYLYNHAGNNTIFGNTISNNNHGMHLSITDGDNKIYHNNFLNNAQHARIPSYEINIWDNGYPSGGNYWSDYEERYLDAEELDGSGIWDTPYVIDDYNQDNYPLMKLWTPPAVVATTDVVPNTLNLRSKGKWITAHIELPEVYSVGEINVSTILLNDEVLAESSKVSGKKLMVQFDRSKVIALLPQAGEVELTVTGTLYDGTPFKGTDTIKVLFPGDVDDDGDVDGVDYYLFAGTYGTNLADTVYNWAADFNEDGSIDGEDYYILAGNYGKTAILR